MHLKSVPASLVLILVKNSTLHVSQYTSPLMTKSALLAWAEPARAKRQRAEMRATAFAIFARCREIKPLGGRGVLMEEKAR